MAGRMVALISGLMVAGCSVVGVRSGTEEPKYHVIDRVGSVEIRQYGPRIAAETVIEADEDSARGEGFRRIAGYIFGANHSHAKIAMTAPVAQSVTAPVAQSASEKIAMTAPVAQAQDASGRWVVRFFMPFGSTMASLPVPDDARVRLVELGPETMGVIRFSGFASVSAMQAHRAALLAALQNAPWRPDGPPVAWYYDPPWTLPFLRRNEVAVPVSRP